MWSHLLVALLPALLYALNDTRADLLNRICGHGEEQRFRVCLSVTLENGP